MAYDINDVKEAVQAGEAVLVDVREQDEWSMGHVADAVLCPLSEIDGGKDPEIDREKTAYTYCRAGQRSYMARDILASRGWTNIVALDEGFDSLVALGFKPA